MKLNGTNRKMLAICSSGRETSSPLRALCKQIISGHGLFPLMRLLLLCSSAPRSMGRGAVHRANPSGLHSGSTHSSPPKNGMASTYHHPRQGHRHRDLLGPGILCKAAPPPRPLWGGIEEGSRSRTELCNQPPQSQRPWHVTAQRFGERLGEGRRLSFLLLLPLLQILANLCVRRCFPSTKEVPPSRGWEPGMAVVVRVCETMACWLPWQKTRL